MRETVASYTLSEPITLKGASGEETSIKALHFRRPRVADVKALPVGRLLDPTTLTFGELADIVGALADLSPAMRAAISPRDLMEAGYQHAIPLFMGSPPTQSAG